MRRVYLSWLCVLGSLLSTLPCLAATTPKNVAVIVYTQGTQTVGALARIAQTRAEQVLGDNKVNVLDQEKSKELKNNNKKLEDPGYLMTAEEFMKTAQKYQIDGIYRVYLNASVVPASTGYFTATANADIRYVDSDAKVTAITTPVMGVKDNPPSDGLTESAALGNAVQRAVDAALEKAGYQISDATAPRLLSLDLIKTDPANTAGSKILSRVPLSGELAKLAELTKRFFSTEESTCSAQSPDKAAGAVGGLTTRRRRLDVLYLSNLHVVDLKDGKEIYSYSTGESRLKLNVTLHDCMFIDNWRFLAGVTGTTLYLWDTERNKTIAEIQLPDEMESAKLTHARNKDGSYLLIDGDGKSYAFQLKTKAK
ncbi:MAG: hypothetical protein WC073_02235 [Sterolibacterium sp.]